jgi:hypothetical protein
MNSQTRPSHVHQRWAQMPSEWHPSGTVKLSLNAAQADEVQHPGGCRTPRLPPPPKRGRSRGPVAVAPGICKHLLPSMSGGRDWSASNASLRRYGEGREPRTGFFFASAVALLRSPAPPPEGVAGRVRECPRRRRGDHVGVPRLAVSSPSPVSVDSERALWISHGTVS